MDGRQPVAERRSRSDSALNRLMSRRRQTAVSAADRPRRGGEEERCGSPKEVGLGCTWYVPSPESQTCADRPGWTPARFREGDT